MHINAFANCAVQPNSIRTFGLRWLLFLCLWSCITALMCISWAHLPNRYYTASLQHGTPASSGDTRSTSGSYWLWVKLVRKESITLSACTYVIAWVFASQTKSDRNFRIAISSFPEKKWSNTLGLFRLMKSLTWPFVREGLDAVGSADQKKRLRQHIYIETIGGAKFLDSQKSWTTGSSSFYYCYYWLDWRRGLFCRLQWRRSGLSDSDSETLESSSWFGAWDEE